MSSKSRTQSSFKNITFSILGVGLTILLQFVSRKVFIQLLSEEYLGLGGLFSNILSVLALSELGIGSAMTFALYAPVASGDKEKIKSLMSLYRKIYNLIGCVILVLGSALTPFLHLLIKDMPDMPYIRVYYLLYVANSGISYFYTYKRTLIICNQDNYISSITTTLSSILTKVLQIALLVLTHSYLAYLIVQIAMTRIENIVISRIADKQYPYLKEKNIADLAPEEKDKIKTNVKAMFCHKIGTVVVNATDNIIISKILGLATAGLFSNYVLITDNVNKLALTAIKATSASVGNMLVNESKEKCYSIYKNMMFANFVIMCFCSCALLCLFQPFITLWLGEKYLLDTTFVLILVACFYFFGMRTVTLVYKEAAGLFRPDRYKALIESAANLAFSIPLTYLLGISGVKLGTLLSTILIPFWIEGYVLFKYFFERKVWQYLLIQAMYAGISSAVIGLTYYICSLFSLNTLLSIFFRAALCCLIPPSIITLLFFKSPEFRYFVEIIRKKLFKKKQRKTYEQ